MTSADAIEPPATASNKKRNWLIAGVLGAVVLLLCCVGGAVGIYLLTRPDSPEKVVEQYLTAMQDHDQKEMLELSCASSNSGLMRDLLNLVTNNTEIISWKILDSQETDRTATVSVRLEYRVTVLGVKADKTSVVTTNLVKSDGEWLVCDTSSRNNLGI